MDIINDEEKQFLKTLSRGQKLLDRTIGKLGNAKVLPGDVAWRLYDTYGFPVDLTQLMAEEFKMTVDMEEYETEKLSAQLASQGKTGGKDDSVSLDVHSINELKDSMKVAPTNDASKYDYVGTEDPANHKFQSCKGKVIALRRNKQFVQSVESGQER